MWDLASTIQIRHDVVLTIDRAGPWQVTPHSVTETLAVQHAAVRRTSGTAHTAATRAFVEPPQCVQNQAAQVVEPGVRR